MIVGYPSGPSSRLCYGINVDRARKLSPTTLDMITQLSRILVDDPSMQDYVYSLYGGECYDQAAPPSAPRWQRSLDGHEKVDVDTLRLEEIIAHNRQVKAWLHAANADSWLHKQLRPHHLYAES